MEQAASYADLKKNMKTLRSEMHKQAKVFFAGEAKAIFDKYPKLESFAWRQYTPYFADGDPCEFGVQTDAFLNGFSEDGDAVDENGDEDEETDETKAELPKAAYGAVQKLLGAFDNDDMEAMFGDHVTVTAKRDGGVSIDDYEHD